MNLSQATMDKQIPITKARRIFSNLIERLPKESYFILVKNYQPKAILLYPELLNKTSQAQIDIDLESIRASEENRSATIVSQALDKITRLPASELPKLLKK